MSTSNSGTGRTEAIGVTIPPSIPAVTSAPPLSAIMSQLEQLMAVVSNLKSRMDSGDNRTDDSFAAARPPPAPPFNLHHSTASANMIPIFTYTPTPSVGTNFSAPISAQTLAMPYSAVPQTLGPLVTSTVPHSLPPYGFSDATSTVTGYIRQQQPANQPWQQDLFGARGPDRTPLRRPQMVNPSSCWGPAGNRPHFGAAHHE